MIGELLALCRLSAWSAGASNKAIGCWQAARRKKLDGEAGLAWLAWRSSVGILEQTLWPTLRGASRRSGAKLAATQPENWSNSLVILKGAAESLGDEARRMEEAAASRRARAWKNRARQITTTLSLELAFASPSPPRLGPRLPRQLLATAWPPYRSKRTRRRVFTTNSGKRRKIKFGSSRAWTLTGK